MSKNKSIAVFASLAFLAYLLFAGPIMDFFNPSIENSNNQMPQTGFTAEEVVVGSGPLAESGDVLTVHYVGTLPDGKVFDSSLDRNTPYTFTLGMGQVIRGWDEGLVGMRAGGKRVITISPEYGYGDQGVGSIPSNSTLIFEVEVLDVQKPQS